MLHLDVDANLDINHCLAYSEVRLGDWRRSRAHRYLQFVEGCMYTKYTYVFFRSCLIASTRTRCRANLVARRLLLLFDFFSFTGAPCVHCPPWLCGYDSQCSLSLLALHYSTAVASTRIHMSLLPSPPPLWHSPACSLRLFPLHLT